MKKTKLLTSLAALGLVLGLGACSEPTEEETTSEEASEVETTDTESSSAGTEVSTEGAYAIVGDFTDSSWNESPDVTSKYFIEAGTTHYEVTVETADVDYEPSFRVVEYGTWNLVADYDNLDVDNSTGVTGSHGNDNNIELAGGVYNLVFDFGETNTIVVTEADPAGDMFAAIADGESFTLETYYYELYTIDYESLEEAQAATSYAYYTEVDVVTTYTKDAVVLEYYVNGSLYDVEGYLNDYNDSAYEADLVLIFYLNDEGALYNTWYGSYGTWQEVLDSPLQFVDYADAFSVNGLSTGLYGEEIGYDIDLTADGLASSLIDNLFIAENWIANYGSVGGPNHVLELLEDETATPYYDYGCTYLCDYDELDIEFETDDMIYVESQLSYDPSAGLTVTTAYWVERDYMCAAIYDVGTTVIDPEWAQYLVLS